MAKTIGCLTLWYKCEPGWPLAKPRWHHLKSENIWREKRTWIHEEGRRRSHLSYSTRMGVALKMDFFEVQRQSWEGQRGRAWHEMGLTAAAAPIPRAIGNHHRLPSHAYAQCPAHLATPLPSALCLRMVAFEGGDPAVVDLIGLQACHCRR